MRSIRRADQKESLKNHVINEVCKCTGNHTEKIFFINALAALDGRVFKDSNLIADSEILEFETQLEAFLATERGRAKLNNPLLNINRYITIIKTVVASHIESMQNQLRELQNKYSNSEQEVNALEQNRNIIVERLQCDVRKIIDDIIIRYDKFLFNLEIDLPLALNQLEEDGALTKELAILDKEASRKAVTSEISEKITEIINSKSSDFQKNVIEQLLEDRFNAMREELTEGLGNFFVDINKLKVEYNLISTTETDAHGDVERLLSAAFGFALGGIGLGTIGAAYGAKTMFKSLIPQIGVLLLVSIFTLNPIVIIGSLLASSTVQILWKKESMTKEYRKTVLNSLISQLKESKATNQTQIQQVISARFQEIEGAITKGINVEINALKEQVKENLRNCELSTTDKTTKEKELNNILQATVILQTQVQTISKELTWSGSKI